jgi:hypothetical protein
MPASLAAVSVAANTPHQSKPPQPSTSHASQPRRRPSGLRPRSTLRAAAQSNLTRARSMLCGRHAPSHAGHRNTLGASCCRTCRRLCAKYGRRPRTSEWRDGRRPQMDLFRSKMVRTGGGPGADDGGAQDKGVTTGTPGGGTLHATRPAPGATAGEQAGKGPTSAA